MAPNLGLRRAKRRLHKIAMKKNSQRTADEFPGSDINENCLPLSPIATCSSGLLTPRKKRRATCFEPIVSQEANKLENISEGDYSRVQHLPIIKSASKTDLKEQKRMMKLRSSSTTLQSLENRKPLKRKLEVPQDTSMPNTDCTKTRRKRLSNDANNELCEEGPQSEDFETISLASTDSCLKRDGSLRGSWRNRLRKMTSIGSVFSSPKVGKQLKRSSSLKSDDVTNAKLKIKKYVQLPTPVKRRSSKLWLETVAAFNCNVNECLTAQQIRRQEAIFELYCGEEDLIEDLKLLKEVYFNEMAKLNLLNEGELEMIFGNIEHLLPLHEDLMRNLKKLRHQDGSINEIGDVLINWIPCLRPYVPYCAQQIVRKDFLDNKIREDSMFADFLQRCLESPFSRKLDLWSFIDAPRNRFVKYPLLFSTIEKLTPENSRDKEQLYDAIKGIEEIISEADKETGRAKCNFLQKKLYFVNNEHSKLVNSSRTLICDGSLRNHNGTKYEGLLFDTVFVLARPATRRGTLVYQVSIEPILLANLKVEEAAESEFRRGGSFKNTLNKAPTDKCLMKVSTLDVDHPKVYLLQAHDDHDRKQWLNCFKAHLS